MPYTAQDNINWQSKYTQQVKSILKQNAMRLITIGVADDYNDRHRATDFIAQIKGGDVAVRIRREDCKYRDWTIRSVVPYGKTELTKLLEGFGDWYLYCWVNETHNINEWMLIDLTEVRNSGLLGNIATKHDIPNGDGTFFKNCTLQELVGHKCLISYQRY